MSPRCPIHDTVLNANGNCLLCDHPELDPDGLTAEQAQAELDAIPDRPLTPEEVAEIEENVYRFTKQTESLTPDEIKRMDDRLGPDFIDRIIRENPPR
jgi:hypothetical protein